jgi:hypothetical protein
METQKVIIARCIEGIQPDNKNIAQETGWRIDATDDFLGVPGFVLT